MTPIELRVRRLAIPMRTRFKHASAERRAGDSVWVEARRGGRVGLGEGCPRDYVTGESGGQAAAWLAERAPEIAAEADDPAALRDFVDARRGEIDAHPAAWCAAELALLDLFGHEAGRSVEALLGLPSCEGSWRYTAVVGDEPLERTAGLCDLYLAAGFRDFKLKVGGVLDDDRARLALLLRKAAERGAGAPRVRLDANNLWAGKRAEAERFLAALEVPLWAVEEPLAPRAFEELSRLSAATGLPVILDESLCRAEDLDAVAGRPGAWIPNVRVSKVGGLLRALAVVERARELGFPIVVGAQVGETSVLTRAALVAARAAGPALAAQEGAFGTLLLARDPVRPVLQFGEGGVLAVDAERAAAPGLGLEPAPEEA